MKSLSTLWLIILLVSVQSTIPIDSAILHQRPIQLPINLKNEQPIEHYDQLQGSSIYVTTTNDNSIQPKQPSTTNKHPDTATKFILLTTGEQIKLYPFVQQNDSANPTSQTEEQQKKTPELTLANVHYIIKPADFDTQQRETLTKLANNSFTRWITEKAAQRQASRSPPPSAKSQQVHGRHGNKASILPGLSGLEDEEATFENSFTSRSGWQKPWIVDVDYFFSHRFCRQSPAQLRDHDCLVVVWLDKKNNYVRYGSLDLIKNPIEFNNQSTATSRNNDHNKVLWLQEFPPIDVASEAMSPHHGPVIQVEALVVNKRRQAVYVSYTSAGKQYYYKNILSGGFRSEWPTQSGESQLLNKSIRVFNICRDKPDFDSSSIENLDIYDEKSDAVWLFYFDKHSGGKIFALMDTQQTSDISDNTDRYQIISRVLVRDLSSTQGQQPYQEQALFEKLRDTQLETLAENATGLAMDPKRHKLYWITQANKLYSCDYNGLNGELIGKLSNKPAIRSPNAMQVFQGTLYISDPIKKSLIAYKLPGQEDLSSDDELDMIYSDLREDIGNYSSHDQLNDEINPTHKVLLVEMPSLFGFRLVDIDETVRYHNGPYPSVNCAQIRDENYNFTFFIIELAIPLLGAILLWSICLWLRAWFSLLDLCNNSALMAADRGFLIKVKCFSGKG